MSKLKGLLLTQGMHGMISQVEGLAKALDIDFTHHKVELNNFWKIVPPKLTPVSQNVYKKINESDFDIIISCGRKSVIPSIHLKSIPKKKVLNIHIQDPKVDFNHFDFIVAPEHDGISGANVIKTKGAIHYLTENEIEYINMQIYKMITLKYNFIHYNPLPSLELKEKENNFIIQLGQLELEIQNLELQKENILDQVTLFNQEKKDLAKMLQEKYGEGTFDLDSGEFIKNS